MKTQTILAIVLLSIIFAIILQGCQEKSNGLTITSTTIYPPFYGNLILKPRYHEEGFAHPRFINSDSIIFTDGSSGEGGYGTSISVFNIKTKVMTSLPNSTGCDYADMRNGIIIFGTNFRYFGPIHIMQHDTISMIIEGNQPCFNAEGSAFVFVNNDSLFIFSFADSSRKLLYVGGNTPEWDGHTIYFQYVSYSTSDHWYHLYSIPDTGGTPTQLTSGAFNDLGPRADRGYLIFTRGVYGGNDFNYTAIIQREMSVVLSLPALGGDPDIFNNQILYSDGGGLHLYEWKSDGSYAAP